jgi:hypothetical protein
MENKAFFLGVKSEGSGYFEGFLSVLLGGCLNLETDNWRFSKI